MKQANLAIITSGKTYVGRAVLVIINFLNIKV